MQTLSKTHENDKNRTFELVAVECTESAKVEGGAALPLPPYIPGPCFPRPPIVSAKM